MSSAKKIGFQGFIDKSGDKNTFESVNVVDPSTQRMLDIMGNHIRHVKEKEQFYASTGLTRMESYSETKEITKPRNKVIFNKVKNRKL
jgi:hypothetical protein